MLLAISTYQFLINIIVLPKHPFASQTCRRVQAPTSKFTERADSDTHHIMTIIRKLLVRHARPRVNHGCTSRIHGSKSSKYSTDHAHRPTAAPGRAACSTLTAPAREALRLNSLHALSHIMFGFRQQGYCSCSRTRCRLSSKLPSATCMYIVSSTMHVHSEQLTQRRLLPGC
jgi:hypothetical protein